MRHLPIVVAAVISATFSAQTVYGAGSDPQQIPARGAAAAPPHQVTRPPTPPAAPTPPPALPPQVVAPPITYPLPPIMMPPTGGLIPRFSGNDLFLTNDQRRRGRSSRRGQFGGSYFYAPLVTGYPAVADSMVTAPEAPVAPSIGFLRLSVTPASAQVFIDSYFVGTVQDIEAQRVLTLDAGPHRIEFRAPQYQTLTVDLRISPRETVTYRAALEPIRPPVPAVPAPASAGPMYVIPNCYLGNVPPRPSRLPSGCDINRVQVLGRK